MFETEPKVDLLQWNLGKRDDRDEYYNTDGKGLGVVGDRENVRSDFVLDEITKHEPTNDGH